MEQAETYLEHNQIELLEIHILIIFRPFDALFFNGLLENFNHIL